MELFQQLNHDGVTIVQVAHTPDRTACGHRLIRLRDGWTEP
jgi:ABC-type lipoprotein export system ATPase subunit